MTHTESVDTTDDMPDHARGYVRAYGMLFPRSHPRWFTAGGHGVVTTADDLSQWLIAQNDQGVSAVGRRVVSARSVDVMHTPPKGREYAMGWSLSPSGEKPRQIRHTGQLLTHNAIQTLLPDSRTGIAIVANTGMISGDDAAVMLDGLVDLAQGKPPTVRTPFTMKADYVLAVLTLLAIALGVLGAVRARRWARRTADRPLWRVGLRMLPCAVPIVLFAQLTDLAGLFMNRRGTLAQLGYAWPALVIWSVAAALASTVVITARSLAVLRTRRTRVLTAPGVPTSGRTQSRYSSVGQLIDEALEGEEHDLSPTPIVNGVGLRRWSGGVRFSQEEFVTGGEARRAPFLPGDHDG